MKKQDAPMKEILTRDEKGDMYRWKVAIVHNGVRRQLDVYAQLNGCDERIGAIQFLDDDSILCVEVVDDFAYNRELFTKRLREVAVRWMVEASAS